MMRDIANDGNSRAGRKLADWVAPLCATMCLLVLGACASGKAHSDDGGDRTSGSGSGAVSAKVALDIADRSRATGDLAGAATFYRRALQIDPSQQAAMIGLGDTLLDAGAPNDAAETFQKALDQWPNNPGAQSGFGIALVELNRPAAAVDLLRKSIAAAPTARAYRALAVAEDMQGQYDAAAEDCRKGLSLAPGDLGLQTDLGLSLALAGNFDAAVATMRAAASAPEATARHRQNLALVLGLAGRDEEALKVAGIDLDEVSARSNLAYYAQLRALPAKGRAEAILRPGAAPGR